jgi:hypothetical protein
VLAMMHNFHPFAGTTRKKLALASGGPFCCDQCSFIVDGIRPTGADEPFNRELNKQVSKMKGVENACVINRDRGIRGHDWP